MLCNSCVRTAPASQPFETLEPRRLMAVTLSTVPYMGGTQLRVTGTEEGDQVAVSYNPSLGGLVIADGTSTTVYGGPLNSVRVDALGGNDNVVFDPSVTLPAFLHGGEGDDSLIGG